MTNPDAPRPLYLGTADRTMVRLPDALRITGALPHTLVEELFRQSLIEGYREVSSITGDTPQSETLSALARVADPDGEPHLVILDLLHPLHPPVGPAAAQYVRDAYAHGHYLLAVVPTEHPQAGHTILPAHAPFFITPMTPEAERETLIRSLVARDRQAETLAHWAEHPGDGLLVTADGGALTRAVTTTIPDPSQQEAAA